jgi:ATP-dependent protease ClpP protease subunit
MLMVNTDGGSAYAALALIGAIEMSATPVHTYAIGKAFSAGLWIVASGHVRFAHYLTTFMYHEVADLNIGKLESQKRQMLENERLMKMMDNFLLENTAIDAEKLAKQDLSDWYFTAKEAVQMGVVDFLIEVEHQAPQDGKKRKKKKKPIKE